MRKSHDPRLALSAIRARYNDPSKYTETDSWHLFTADEIRREVARYWNSICNGSESLILNAGAGGNDLSLLPPTTVNLDISERRISRSSRPLAASIEAIPLKDKTVDIVLCVGSVINYCDAALAIAEFGRVLKPKGYLVLEFESSLSAELITQGAFGRSAAIAETFFGNQAEAVWVYLPTYIHNLLSAADFRLKRRVPIHILSPWVLLVVRSIRAAAVIARLDRVARYLPFLSHWASNHLVFYQKCI